jgi:hypothetical protein
MPITIIPAVSSMYHAKSGIVASVLPGARVFSNPTMNSMTAAIAEISTKPGPRTHTSVFTFGK